MIPLPLREGPGEGSPTSIGNIASHRSAAEFARIQSQHPEPFPTQRSQRPPRPAAPNLQPFRVTCETCRSRLKVREASAIGQIHACPKCGSMVLIKPPANWAGAAPAAAAALGATPPSSTAAESPLTVSTSVGSVDFADFALDLSAPNAVTRQSAAPTPATTPTEPAVAEVATATGGFSPLIWGTAGLLAMLAGAAVTIAIWPRGNKPTPPVASPTTAIASQPTAADNEESTETPAPSAPPEPTADIPQEQPANARPADAATAGIASKEVAPAVEVAKPVSQVANISPESRATPGEAPATAQSPAASNAPVPVAASATPKLADGPTDRPDAPPSTATAASHVLKFDPLDFDPEHLSLSTRPTASGLGEPAASATTSIPAAPPNDATAVEKANPEKVPDPFEILPPPVGNQAVNVRRGPATAADGSLPDSTQHLSLKLKSLAMTDVPLARFVDTLSNMASAPIALDPLALALNGQSPRSTVSVNVADTTIDKILRDTLAGQRLELVEAGGHLGVALANADERKAVDFDVKDLVTGSDAADIAKLVATFVAPKSWQSAGGKGTIEVRGGSLHIDQTLAVRREALIFCERLRLARTKSLRSKYPADLLTLDSPYAKLAAKLRHPTTFTFLAWTRLADVVHQWQEMTGLTILVDWSALRDTNLVPTSSVACSTIDRPWSEALDGVLAPLGLAWWAPDAQTLCITSHSALGNIEQVEFYTIPAKIGDQPATAANAVELLQQQIAARPAKHADDANLKLQLDEPSNRVVVRATPDIHRFLQEHLSAQ